MDELLADARELPTGAHALSLHVNHEEASEHAAAFLLGAPPGQATRFWVGERSLATYLHDKLSRRAPDRADRVVPLDHEHVARVEGRLRPVPELLEFLRAHPEGVSAGADTLSLYWTAETIPDHLEYEAWVDGVFSQKLSRLVCPYDLRRFPPELAANVLRELGRHHTHCVPSASQEPTVRLLQLFVFGDRCSVPEAFVPALRWAEHAGLLTAADPPGRLELSEEGRRIVHRWSHVAAARW